MKSDKLSWGVKLESWFHFTTQVPYSFLTIIMFTLNPLISYSDAWTFELAMFTLCPLTVYLLIMIIAIYTKPSSSNGHYKTFWQRTKRLCAVPLLMVFGSGMMVLEAAATIDGLISDDATFHRTPKEGSQRLDSYLDEEDSVVEETAEVTGNAQGNDRPKKGRSCDNPHIEAVVGLIFVAYHAGSIAASVIKLGEIELWMGFALFPVVGLTYIHAGLLFSAIGKPGGSHQRRKKSSKASESSDESAEETGRSSDDEPASTNEESHKDVESISSSSF